MTTTTTRRTRTDRRWARRLDGKTLYLSTKSAVTPGQPQFRRKVKKYHVTTFHRFLPKEGSRKQDLIQFYTTNGKVTIAAEQIRKVV